MKYNALEYTIRVWLTSVLFGPILLILGLLMHSQGEYGILLVAILFGAFLSIPSFFLLYFFTKYSTKLQDNIIITKCLLTIVGILLTYIPFYILNGYHLMLDGDLLSRYFFISYCIVIIFGVWFYKLKLVDAETIFQEL